MSALERGVVDKSGKPVAGANIVCTAVRMNADFFPDGDLRTDRDGKLSINGRSRTYGRAGRASFGRREG
jgi:hypothetical protein